MQGFPRDCKCAFPLDVFDGLRGALAANRSQFFVDLPSGPFYGFNTEGATVHQGVIQNWGRQGMMGRAPVTAYDMARSPPHSIACDAS
jgi:hypothetical protein